VDVPADSVHHANHEGFSLDQFHPYVRSASAALSLFIPLQKHDIFRGAKLAGLKKSFTPIAAV
jgi:hypothetical protein